MSRNVLLPPLLVDGEPKILHKMTLIEVQKALSQALKSALGDSAIKFSGHRRPDWWPDLLDWDKTYYKQIQTNFNSAQERQLYMCHLLTLCYRFYNQEETLHLFDVKPGETPLWRIEQKGDVWHLYGLESGRQLWEFRKRYQVLALMAQQEQERLDQPDIEPSVAVLNGWKPAVAAVNVNPIAPVTSPITCGRSVTKIGTFVTYNAHSGVNATQLLNGWRPPVAPIPTIPISQVTSPTRRPRAAKFKPTPREFILESNFKFTGKTYGGRKCNGWRKATKDPKPTPTAPVAPIPTKPISQITSPTHRPRAAKFRPTPQEFVLESNFKFAGKTYGGHRCNGWRKSTKDPKPTPMVGIYNAKSRQTNTLCSKGVDHSPYYTTHRVCRQKLLTKTIGM